MRKPILARRMPSSRVNVGASLCQGLSRDQHPVVSAITACRSSVLSGHTSRCEDCAQIDVAYYHVVFTLPAPIADIALSNKADAYDALFKATAETLMTIGADQKHLGAKLGATLVLHTWGSAMTHHSHIHGIVPGGGLSPDGLAWIDCRARFFLPVRVLSRLFRRLRPMLKREERQPPLNSGRDRAEAKVARSTHRSGERPGAS